MKENSLEEITILEKHIENLENKIKQLERKNKDTIKLTANYNDSKYEIDTQISRKYKDGDILYLADNYKEPTKLKFFKYRLDKTINADFIITAEVLNLKKNKFEYYNDKAFFKSKNAASDKYLERRQFSGK